MPSLNTDYRPFRKVLGTNATGNAYTAQTDSLTAPAETTAGVIEIGAGEGGVPNTVLVKFFGTGADNTTGACRVYGYREVVRNVAGTVTRSHTPILLWGGTFTLSARVGVASGVVVDTERYADTIVNTANEAIDNVSSQTLSPVQDVPAHVLIDTKGCRWLKFDLIVGSGSPATDVNALVSGV